MVLVALGGYVKISGMIDESMDKEQMALPPQPWEFRSKPAYQRLIIMLGERLTFILAFIIYRMAFVYGDTYIANADMKDGLLIENQAMLNAGFKTVIISVDGTKIKKFDNDINMKVVLERSLSKETEPRKP
jgi:regulator of sigma E protease